jgi:hypothetical protein
MLFSDPLRRPMPGYRGQDHMSLSGAVGRGEPTHLGPKPLGASTHHDASQGGAPFRQYDPIVTSYESNAPRYSPPAPWFAGMTHLSSPHEAIPPNRPPSHVDRPDPVRYEHSLMTPAIFQQLLKEVSTAGPLRVAAETARPEVMRSTGAASTPECRSGESTWAAPKLLGEHAWCSARSTVLDTHAARMPMATIRHEPLAEVDLHEALESRVCMRQPQHGLEAVIQGSMPLQSRENQFEMERRPLGQQMQKMEHTANRFVVPGSEPGACRGRGNSSM